MIPPSAALFPQEKLPPASWVRSALLYWDELVRLVPEERAEDNDEVRALIDDGLVRDERSASFREAAAARFRERSDALGPAQFAKLANGMYGKRKSAKVRMTEMLLTVGSSAKEDEITAELLAYLKGRSTAVALDTTILMPQNIEAMYRVALGGAASDRLGLSFLASKKPDSMASLVLRHASTAAKTPESGAFAALAVPWPSGASLKALDTKGFLKFRKTWVSARAAFREEFHKWADELTKATTPEQAEEHLRSKQRELEHRLGELKRALDAGKAKALWTLLQVQVPTMIGGAISQGFAPEIAPVISTSLFSLGLINWYGQVKVEREKLLSTSAGYMLALQQLEDDHAPKADSNETRKKKGSS